MRKMTLQEIKVETMSTHATRANSVYRAKRDTFISIDPDGDKTTQNNIDIKVSKGELAIISGCGKQSESGVSAYLLGDKWGASFDTDWELYANEPGEEVDG